LLCPSRALVAACVPEENLRRLRENAQANGQERRQSPPREGLALLQGLLICGRFGERMTVRYRSHHGRLLPIYVCQQEGIQTAQPICQSVVGAGLDDAIGELLVEALTPLALEVALAVQQELDARAEALDGLRRQQVERARYEAELAQRRFLRVDPDHRLVADSLEAEWNHKLRALGAAQEDYERHRKADGALVDEQQRTAILALATDFPRLWRDPQTPDRERKRMVRLLLADVTLHKEDELVAHVRFRGGTTKTLRLPLPLKAWQLRLPDPQVVAEIDHLLDHYTDAQVVAILNERGLRPGQAPRFSRLILFKLRQAHGLDDRYTRLRRQGLLTQEEMAVLLGVCVQTVKQWRYAGLLRAQVFNDKGSCLYDPPGDNAPRKSQGSPLRFRQRPFLTERPNEVQCSA
jgi:hypothetical protein